MVVFFKALGKTLERLQIFGGGCKVSMYFPVL